MAIGLPPYDFDDIESYPPEPDLPEPYLPEPDPEEEIMEKIDLFEMDLHEQIMIEEISWEITRVPGGWIYRHKFGEMCCFVPLNNEFSRKHRRGVEQPLQLDSLRSRVKPLLCWLENGGHKYG